MPAKGCRQRQIALFLGLHGLALLAFAQKRFDFVYAIPNGAANFQRLWEAFKLGKTPKGCAADIKMHAHGMGGAVNWSGNAKIFLLLHGYDLAFVAYS
ncbi:hypothetical protein D3C81_1574230 [compost metagenome]